MATRKRPSSEEALMTDANIAKVISLLEPADDSKPITKKDACAMLGMAYNTTRLATILNTFKEKQARDAKRRAEKRGKPATADEIVYVIQEYIRGETIDSISKATYRGPSFVKGILERHAVPIRATSHDYFKPELVPEDASQDRFTVGETVYSTRYDSLARIEGEQKTSEYGWIYRVWLLGEKWQQFAYSAAYDLASLKHLRELGVKV